MHNNNNKLFDVNSSLIKNIRNAEKKIADNFSVIMASFPSLTLLLLLLLLRLTVIASMDMQILYENVSVLFRHDLVRGKCCVVLHTNTFHCDAMWAVIMMPMGKLYRQALCTGDWFFDDDATPVTDRVVCASFYLPYKCVTCWISWPHTWWTECDMTWSANRCHSKTFVDVSICFQPAGIRTVRSYFSGAKTCIRTDLLFLAFF